MKPVKIAMMGMTHGHTRKYYQTLIENSKLDWIASCAENEEARQVYELYKTGVPCYLDPEEMLAEHPDIEAIVIASANDRHFEQMKFCAERGLHILSMKIPTFDMAEYDKMIEMVDRAGIVCQIELEMHYNPVVKRLQEIISSGKLGKLISVQATGVGVPMAGRSQGELRQNCSAFVGGSSFPRRCALRSSAYFRYDPLADRRALQSRLCAGRAESPP